MAEQRLDEMSKVSPHVVLPGHRLVFDGDVKDQTVLKFVPSSICEELLKLYETYLNAKVIADNKGEKTAAVPIPKWRFRSQGRWRLFANPRNSSVNFMRKFMAISSGKHGVLWNAQR